MGAAHDTVLESVITVLQDTGWQHSYLPQNCFDILGKGEEHAALLKVHENIDSVTKTGSVEMKRAARYLSAAPLIVGERNSRGDLEKQVIYERYGIPTINPETLEAYLDLQQRKRARKRQERRERLQERSRELFVMNRKGGYYIPIDPKKVEEKRKEHGYSVNGLAKEVGVTSRTITNYRENGVATVETADRLLQVLGDVLRDVELFASEHGATAPEDTGSKPVAGQAADEPAASRLTQRLIRIGLEASGFQQAAFDVAARDEEDSFVVKKADHRDTEQMELLHAIRDLADSNPFLVTRRRKRDTARQADIGTISEHRLREIRSKAELKEEIL